MDCAPNVNIFRELQVVHDTGYLPLSSRSHISPEEDWQQVYLTEFTSTFAQVGTQPYFNSNSNML